MCFPQAEGTVCTEGAVSRGSLVSKQAEVECGTRPYGKELGSDHGESSSLH